MIIYYTDRFQGGRTESHRLLERSIAEYTGDAAKAKELAGALVTAPSGKPFIEGFRHFSISHTGSIWAVLIDRRECGLDIQLPKKCDMAAIARRLFDPADADRIDAALTEWPAAAEEAFFHTWTRREALAKAIGGSVFDGDLPIAKDGRAIINGRHIRLSDIGFPGMPRLYASLCVERGDGEETGRPEFCVLTSGDR